MNAEDKRLLRQDEVRSALGKLDGWRYDEEKRTLVRVWKFEKYVPTMAFIRKLTEVMDKENHHSDLTLDGRSKTLTVTVTTFSENAVTRADLNFAKVVGELEY